MEFNFKGKVALVTGGGSGLGRECALLFAKGGANVLVADLIPERCETVAKEVEALGVEAIAYALDVTDYKQVADMYKVAFQAIFSTSTRADLEVENGYRLLSFILLLTTSMILPRTTLTMIDDKFI